MNNICGVMNWETVAQAAAVDGLGLCIRPPDHSYLHRDCFGRTWAWDEVAAERETEEERRERFARETGGHPDDTPWNDVTTPEPNYRAIAHYLFSLLDGIDTAEDAARDNDGLFRKIAHGLHRGRFQVAHVDGDEVQFLPGPVPKRPNGGINPIQSPEVYARQSAQDTPNQYHKEVERLRYLLDTAQERVERLQNALHDAGDYNDEMVQRIQGLESQLAAANNEAVRACETLAVVEQAAQTLQSMTATIENLRDVAESLVKQKV